MELCIHPSSMFVVLHLSNHKRYVFMAWCLIKHRSTSAYLYLIKVMFV